MSIKKLARSATLQMRQDVARPMTCGAAAIGCLLTLAGSAPADQLPAAGARGMSGVASNVDAHMVGPGQYAQLPRWSLADPPVMEIGRNGGVLLGSVQDAAVMTDGTVLLVDQQPRHILRVSPAGQVIEALGGLGDGPGEFRRIGGVFAVGDTIVAYDSGLSRVTVWRPESEAPEMHALPHPGGRPARNWWRQCRPRHGFSGLTSTLVGRRDPA